MEREILKAELIRLGQDGHPTARDALASLYIRYEETQARKALFEQGLLPEDPEQRALLFFLAGEWARYRELDFDGSLLINAYERAGRSLRHKLLEHSRRSGQMEWLRGLSGSVDTPGSGSTRWLHDLTDADWQAAIRALEQQSRHTDLWRLAQVAPPLWSAAIMDRMKEDAWLPVSKEEREGYLLLREKAALALASPLTIRPKKRLHAPTSDFTCLAMHPAGRLLAAGNSEQRIFVWSLPDGVLRDPVLGSPTAVTRALAFSPEEDLLAAAGGDHRIRAYRTQAGQIVKVLEGHSAMLRGVAIHPDGRTLYSAGFDGSARAWRFPHGALIRTMRGGGGEIFSLALSAAGTHLLTAGADSIVYVWSLPEGTLSRELVGHTETITLLAASATGELVASAGRDGTLRIWNYASGTQARVISLSVALTALVMHPNDQVLIGGSSDGSITLWNLSTGQVIETLTAHAKTITGLAVSPDGNRLYSSDSAGTLQAWDLQSFLEIRLAGAGAQPGALNSFEQRLQDTRLTPAEKRWTEYAAALARWRQRFDIELAGIENIAIGEFDIEII
jgi:WD40 repeat protein